MAQELPCLVLGGCAGDAAGDEAGGLLVEAHADGLDAGGGFFSVKVLE